MVLDGKSSLGWSVVGYNKTYKESIALESDNVVGYSHIDAKSSSNQ